jgi:hypothetical protein
LLIWNIILLALTGCEEQRFPTGEAAAKVDKSLLTDEPCAAPCWYGIEPGVSTRWEARRIIDGLEFVRSSTDIGSGILYWESSLMDPGIENHIKYQDYTDIVQEIGIWLEYELPLKDLIDAKGEPDGLIASYMDMRGVVSVQAFWKKYGLYVGLDTGVEHDMDAAIDSIEPDTRVFAAYYSSIEDMELDIKRRGYIEWDGY